MRDKITSRKHPDWPSLLAARIHKQNGVEPAWGTADCITWAADCVLAMTGEDDIHEGRGRYSTARGALRVLNKVYGVKLPIDLMDKLWGPRVHISQARIGDIVVKAESEPFAMGPAAGVCYGRRSLFVGTEAGVSGLVAEDTLSLEHCYQPWVSSSKQLNLL
jgi:hypothetical protein